MRRPYLHPSFLETGKRVVGETNLFPPVSYVQSIPGGMKLPQNGMLLRPHGEKSVGIVLLVPEPRLPDFYLDDGDRLL